jgi:hypothetical protein
VLTLITDRNARNVYRRKELLAKGWANMTAEERNEWSGDPFTTPGANLFATGTYYPSGVELTYKDDEIIATAVWSGVYLFAISIIGRASDFENRILTLSAEGFVAPSKIEIFWHDDSGYDYAGGTLLNPGSTTFNTAWTPNVNNREYLAAYLYMNTDTSVEAGNIVTYKKVMLEVGEEKHEYAPYYEIIPTLATKGAYNYSDLNRVERAVAEIAERAGLTLYTKTYWTVWDLPTDTEMARYLDNVNAIKTHFGINIPLPESMNNLTHEGANNIELILSRAYELLTQ